MASERPGKPVEPVEPGTGARLSRPPVHRISLSQLALLLLCWASLHHWDEPAANSFLLGGLILIVPNAWFALGVFRWRGASVARQAVRASYAAEIGKFLLTFAGFAVVFATIRPIAAWAVFAGYIAMLVAQIIGAWLLLRTTGSGR